MCVAETKNDTVVEHPGKALSGKAYDAGVLAPQDEWIAKLDHVAFKEDIRAMGKTLADQQGPADEAHLRKIIWWSRLCQLSGFFSMWYMVNPVSIYLLSLGCMTRWTIVAHHVCHGGFDKCSGGRFNRFTFGVGSLWRRAVDWLDWMLVEAWNVEHNQLHHYCLGEVDDPDLVEHNLGWIRDAEWPMAMKYLVVAFFLPTWKWFYYAPNTFKMLQIHKMRREGKVPTWKGGKPVPKEMLQAAWTISPLWFIGKHGPIFFTCAQFFGGVLGPYFLQRFVLTPLPFLLVSRAAYTNALLSLVLAELLTNAHAFLNIVTNHAGDDLYRFEHHCVAKTSTFYLRQIISSVNFRTGSDLNDFTHGWLNYQIEHHLWPDLSMLSYQKSAPLVKALCAKHGVPYLQHSVWWRLKKTVEIMVGANSMRRFPSAFENAADLAVDAATKAQ